jgi:hypothetical protein
LTVIVTPPAAELIALAPWVKPIPDPLATELIVTPVVPAKAPADRAPVIVTPAPFKKAVVAVARVAQPKQVLSKRIYPGTVIAGTEIMAPLVLTR